MAKEISDQDIITGLQALESSLWKTLLENRSFDLDNVSALIRDTRYMAAVGIRGHYIDDIEFFRNPNEECHGSESPSLSDEELLLLARGDESQKFMERFFSPRDLQCLRGTSDDSSKNIGPERVELVILLDRVDRLFTAIPVIQKMQAAQQSQKNMTLTTKAARKVFSALDPYTQKTVREVFELARSQQRSSYDTMNHGLSQTFPQGEEAQALEQRNRSVQTYTRESVLLNSLLSLSDATRPAFRAEKIAETVALLREDPAGTIKSGIKHVTKSVLASASARVPFLENFLARSNDHTQ
jgi:hypothetical protein